MVIVLIGLNDKQIKTLPSNMIGLKRTENTAELVKLYSQSGIILSLSLEETFGLTIVEGFACGKPAIVYDCTATPELVNDETGLIVEARNILGVRDAIDTIRKSKIDYSIKCRLHAERNYNQDVIYDKYIRLYKSILK